MADSQPGDYLPLNKRPRVVDAESVDSSPTQLFSEAKRDEEFWLEDGNIILVTTTRPTAFRIYKALLTRQIEIFADMFASSTPHEGEMYQGCPVVQLPDAPEDLRHLLRVLVPSKTPLFWRNKGDPLPTLHSFSAIIRLSHKYHIEQLQKQALAALKEHYCDTLDAYDARVPIYDQNDLRSGQSTVEIIELARLTDTPSLLPVALYECFIKGQLHRGWHREDGTLIRLSIAHQQRCKHARDEFAEASHDRVIDMIRLAIEPRCGAKCKDALVEFCSDMDSEHLPVCDPLNGGVRNSWSWWLEHWTESPNGGWSDRAPCQECVEAIRDHELKDRRALWARLPSIFGITVPGWPDS